MMALFGSEHERSMLHSKRRLQCKRFYAPGASKARHHLGIAVLSNHVRNPGACCVLLQVLLQYRTARNYCSATYTLPRVMEKVLFAVVVLSLYWNTGTNFSTLNVPVLSSLLFLMVLSPICSAIIYLPGGGSGGEAVQHPITSQPVGPGCRRLGSCPIGQHTSAVSVCALSSAVSLVKPLCRQSRQCMQTVAAGKPASVLSAHGVSHEALAQSQ